MREEVIEPSSSSVSRASKKKDLGVALKCPHWRAKVGAHERSEPMASCGEMKRLTERSHQYEATYRFEYQINRFIQVRRIIDAKTIGLATLFAMEWAKREKADLQDIIELSKTRP